MLSIWYRRYLSKQDLDSIASAIGEAENSTSGEIRVVVRHRRHWGERNMSPHDIALKEFYKLGMERTRDRTGVLILLLFSQRKYQIIADEGIHARVAEGTWDNIAASMGTHFKTGNFCDGICSAIKEVGGILSKHFPRKADDANELPNSVVED